MSKIRMIPPALAVNLLKVKLIDVEKRWSDANLRCYEGQKSYLGMSTQMPLTHLSIKNPGGPQCTEHYVAAEMIEMKKKRPVPQSLKGEQGRGQQGTVTLRQGLDPSAWDHSTDVLGARTGFRGGGVGTGPWKMEWEGWWESSGVRAYGGEMVCKTGKPCSGNEKSRTLLQLQPLTIPVPDRRRAQRPHIWATVEESAPLMWNRLYHHCTKARIGSLTVFYFIPHARIVLGLQQQNIWCRMWSLWQLIFLSSCETESSWPS